MWDKLEELLILKRGGIHIKKKNRGKFTESANRAGMGVQEFANHVLANKDKYSPTLVKRANFARNSKKFKHNNGGILKAQQGDVIKQSLLEMIPIYGTYKNAERFIQNPTWYGAGSTALSLLGDATMFTGLGWLIKGASTANKAAKAYKLANRADELLTATRKANETQQLARQYKHNENVIHSLSLLGGPKANTLIPKRIKSNQVLASELVKRNAANEIAYNNTIKATQAASDLATKSRQYYELAKPFPIATVGAKAASVGVTPIK